MTLRVMTDAPKKEPAPKSDAGSQIHVLRGERGVGLVPPPVLRARFRCRPIRVHQAVGIGFDRRDQRVGVSGHAAADSSDRNLATDSSDRSAAIKDAMAHDRLDFTGCFVVSHLMPFGIKKVTHVPASLAS